MKRLLLAAALSGLAACQGIDASKPNRYACDPKAALTDGGNAGCPGGFRCNAAEGFCFDPAEGVPQPCSSSLDCGAAWRCSSAERVCFDPEAGMPLRCASSTDCAAGWRCNSRFRSCFPADETRGAPLLCAVEEDCADGWHCGVSGVCNSLSVKEPYPCRRDGGDPLGRDCTSGWRCGLDGVCQDTSTGAAYPCDPGLPDDAGCEQGWRCGPDRRCVDSANDALLVNADAGVPSGAAAFPRVAGATPVAAAISDTWIASYGCQGRTNADTVALVTDAGLVRLVFYGRGGGDERSREGFPVKADGGPVSTMNGGVEVCAPPGEWRYLASRVGGAPLPDGMGPSDVRDVAQVDDGLRSITWLLREDGTVYLLAWRPDGGVDVAKHALALTDARLHLGLPGRANGLAVLSSNAVAVWSDDAGGFTRAALDGGDVIDVEVVPGEPDGGSGDQLLVARWRGLIDRAPLSRVADPLAWTAGGMEPGLCPGGIDDAGTIVELRGTVTDGSPAVMVWTRWQVSARGEAHDQIAIYPTAVDGGWAFDCDGPPLAHQGCLWLNAADPRWPPRELFLGRGGANPGQPPPLSWTRGTGDGGVELFIQEQDVLRPGLCGTNAVSLAGRELEPFASQTRWFKSNPRRWLAAGEGGRLWVSAQNAEAEDMRLRHFQLPLDALTPASAPDGVYLGLASPLLVLPGLERSTVSGAAQLVSPGVFAVNEAGALTRSPWDWTFQPALPVAGRPTWMGIVSAPGASMPALLFVDLRSRAHLTAEAGIVAAGSSPAQQPVRATAAPQADGGALLLVSIQNTLFSSELGAASEAGLPMALDTSWASFPQLRAVEVPLVAGSITSLAQLPAGARADGGTQHALGYLVSSGRVFRYRADNPIVWRSEEVSISDAEAVEVWADGTRARVGFRDGTVFSLPSRAQVAPALMAGATSVLELRSVCGHTFALATPGLYHLVASAQNQPGAWQPVSLPGAASAASYAGWRLFADARPRPDGTAELLLFGPRGEAVRVSGFGCVTP